MSRFSNLAVNDTAYWQRTSSRAYGGNAYFSGKVVRVTKTQLKVLSSTTNLELTFIRDTGLLLGDRRANKGSFHTSYTSLVDEATYTQGLIDQNKRIMDRRAKERYSLLSQELYKKGSTEHLSIVSNVIERLVAGEHPVELLKDQAKEMDKLLRKERAAIVSRQADEAAAILMRKD